MEGSSPSLPSSTTTNVNVRSIVTNRNCSSVTESSPTQSGSPTPIQILPLNLPSLASSILNNPPLLKAFLSNASLSGGAGANVKTPLSNTVTPGATSISQSPPTPTHSRSVNFNVRVFNPLKKKEFDVYVLRNVSQAVNSPELLRKELLKQFGGRIVSLEKDSPIGFFNGNTKIIIQTTGDIDEVWRKALSGEDVILWCRGSSKKAVEVHVVDSGSDHDEDKPPKKGSQHQVMLL